ncbi:MAG: folate family ECF transporter S component [Oscillospiraceae bacterium]|nr:folate family ECF transporter S component [Oscillospiraceae bacterium]
MSKTGKFFSPKRIAIMALFIALQIILARFVGFQISEGLRISIEVVPVILAGIWLGPLAGFVVAFLADILGTIISGYGVYFLPLAVTPILNAVLPGLAFKYIWKKDMNAWKCIVTIIITEIISSLFLGTYALTWYYMLFVPTKQVTFALLFATRIVPKLITMAVDGVIVAALHTAMYKRIIYPMLEGR